MGQGAAMREYEMEVLEKYELEVNNTLKLLYIITVRSCLLFLGME